jgi:proton glutamate symport protein
MVPPSAAARGPQRWWRFSLTQQIMIGLVSGGLVGWLAPEFALKTAFIRDIFINLIKSLIAPLIFSSVVAGIAGGGDAKKVGRLGVKAIVYFELATTLALAVGLAVVNVVKPGRGVLLPQAADGVAAIAQNHPKTLAETLVHIFPASVVDAMATGDVLQIVAFAVIFGLAVVAVGERARPVVTLCEGVVAVMFKFCDLIMRMAPLGVAAAIATTIGKQGPGVLIHLGVLVGSLYLALIIFVLALFGFSAVVLKVPIGLFWQAVRAPFTLAFATASSESALPQAMEAMVGIGVPRAIVGFVIPTGYSFNLDGSTLYLAIASVFVAQAAEFSGAPHFGLGQQISLMLTLMITSKGVAAVPRASLVVLLAALGQYGLPQSGVALIFGVDALMDMARTSVNVLGNCLACVIVAKWEGEYVDPTRARLSVL